MKMLSCALLIALLSGCATSGFHTSDPRVMAIYNSAFNAELAREAAQKCANDPTCSPEKLRELWKAYDALDTLKNSQLDDYTANANDAAALNSMRAAAH